MKVIHEIETNEDCFEVEFEADVEFDNGATDYAGSHASHGEPGVAYFPSFSVEGLHWDENKFTEIQNKIIHDYLYDKKNLRNIEDKFGEIDELKRNNFYF